MSQNIIVNYKNASELILTFIKILFFILLIQETYARNLLVPQEFNTVQMAANNAETGDTILISSGYYKENIVIDKALTIKGTSKNSKVIIEDATPTPSNGYFSSNIFLIQTLGGGEISGLTLQGNNNRDVYCTGIKLTKDGWLVKNCVFQNLAGIYSYESSSIILENIFKNLKGMAVSAGKRTKVIGNFIYGNKEEGVIASGNVYIANNLFENCTFAINGGGETDSICIRNNTITSIGNIYSNNQTGIRMSTNLSPMRIENNIIAFNNGSGLMSSYINSNLENAFLLNNNDVFMNSHDYFYLANPTGSLGNISQDPVFCDNDSLFYLASDSPCINSGEDSISDIDGSTSDIGMFGGPDADKIKYAPSSFDITVPENNSDIHINTDPFSENDSVLILFQWTPSFDRDQLTPPKYRLIIGKNLITDICRNLDCSTYFIKDILDTLYTDSTFLFFNVSKLKPQKYYFNVEAYDNDGLFKRSNTTRSFTIINDNIAPNDFFISQNFPNPFNANTKIRYGIAFRADISIILYDVLGREILTIEKGFKNPGYYETTLNSSTLSSGVYFYKFNLISFNSIPGRKNTTNFPVFKKLIVLK